MIGSGRSAAADGSRVLALFLFYVIVELVLGIFALVGLFRILDGLNLTLAIYNGVGAIVALFIFCFLFTSGPPAQLEHVSFLATSLFACVLMTILRSVWQARVTHDGAEDISPNNEHGFYEIYLILACIRIVLFIYSTRSMVRILYNHWQSPK